MQGRASTQGKAVKAKNSPRSSASSRSKPQTATRKAPRRQSSTKLHPAEQYIADVLSGKIVVGSHVFKSVQRHARDLKEQKKRGIYFDAVSADIAIRFFGCLKHSKGAGHAGKVFELSPWQQFIVWCIFGWKKQSNGMRRFTRAYIEVARKNGKSTFLAGICLLLLVLDGEPGAEIYSAATKKDQARILFSEAQRMVKASPDLKQLVKAYRNNLSVPSTNSKMEPLSSDANSLDGLNPSGAAVDELHAHKTREVWDVLDTATGARLQALLIAITTAGFNTDGICYEQRNYCIDILNGVVDDDSYFSFIAAIDDDDDWQDEKCWPKANPNLGVSCFIEDLRAKAKRAKRSTSSLNNFLIKHLNRWVQQAQRWIPIEKWDACKTKKKYTEADLAGRNCFLGFDLSQKSDLCAAALLFPPRTATVEKWRVVWRFWMPADTVELRAEEGDFRYRDWVKKGFISIAGEGSIDNNVIRDEILALRKKFNIVQVGFDPWSASEMAKNLENAGMVTVEVAQNFKHLSEASKEFEAMIVDSRIEQDNNPVARWMVDNVSILADNNQNIRPVKPKDRKKKIDGVAALVTGLSRALLAPIAPPAFKPFFI